ncbi:MAG: response regulator transcription factor [Coleofasciculus sp. B1-GNL1-01]|uniref:response regulator transcription factor NblR n=1 Tax=Coleofasciculus sp. B1-GNL1-01 TaxID=3068484 RepID=UPI0032FF0311
MQSAPLNGNPCVLLVETDESLAQRMSLDLIEAGYHTVIATDAPSGWHQACEIQPAMMVVDQSLSGSGESGLNLCTRLRKAGSRVPLLLLIARDTIEDRVACLEAGADDFFLKPYRADAFLQMIRLYLEPDTNTSEQLRFGDLVLDLTTRRAMRGGRVIDLTMKEFELLKYLMTHPREVLTREQILENVWGYDFLGESNVIEVYIRYLRLKIEDEGDKRLIQTVRGVGYVLRES